MPDWTYAPVLEPVLRRLPNGAGRRVALSSAARLSRVAGGRALIRLMAGSRPLPELELDVLHARLPSPIGISAGVDRSGQAASALEALGCGFVEVGPVASRDELAAGALKGLLLLRVAPGGLSELLPLPMSVDVLVVTPSDLAAARPIGVTVLVLAPSSAAVAEALAGGAAGVVIAEEQLADLPPGTVSYVEDAVNGPEDAVRLVAAGATLVGLATGLRNEGPGLPQRCAEALASANHLGARPPRARDLAASRSWLASVLIGLALVATGIGAAVISFGPVLLGYDRRFLHGGTEVLDTGRLLDFVQHDRITFAGVALSIGILYSALAWYGVRLGWRWAHGTLVTSCGVGMATLFLFFGFGYFEPLHAAVTALLAPLLLLAALPPRPPATWLVAPEPSGAVRRRALVGQALLVVLAVGLIGGGAVISLIAVTDVFVTTDISFIGVTPDDLRAMSDRIVPFVAHDRAGFGGAMLAQGIAVLGLALWGFRPRAAWVWWALLLGGVASGVPTIAIHGAVGYVSFTHLAPVYLAAALAGTALVLSRGYLCGGRVLDSAHGAGG